MAYSQTAPYGTSQRPQHNGGATTYESSPAERYDTNQGAYRKFDNMNGQSLQHHNDYNAQNSYADYNENPWGNESGGYYKGGHDRRNNRHWERREDRLFTDQSVRRPMRPQWNGQEDPSARRRPNARSRPPNNAPYHQYESLTSHSGHLDNPNYQHWSSSSQMYDYRSQNEHSNDQELNHTAETVPLPHIDKSIAQVHQVQGTTDDDRLPRYLNNGSSSSSRPAPSGIRSHVNDGILKDNDSYTPEQHPFVRNVDHQREITVPTRSKNSHGQHISPEMLAWDNPFPTFPSKSRNRTQRDSSNERRPPNPVGSDNCPSHSERSESRPRTARSKGSHSSSHNSKARSIFPEQYNHNGHNRINAKEANHDDDYPRIARLDPLTLNQGDTGYNLTGSHDVPAANTQLHDSNRINHPDDPLAQGRQSEDKFTRPIMPANVVLTTGYERSKTMPAAVQNSIPDSGLIPTYEQSAWQEPAAVSGYYGPEDKVYLPNGPDQNTLHRPRPPPKSQSYDNHWETKNVAGNVQTHNARQRHILAGSKGEIHGPYLEEPSNRFEVDPHGQSHRKLSPSDEEMPNFGTSVNEFSHQRRETVNQRLGSQSEWHEPSGTQTTGIRNQHRDYHPQQNPVTDQYANDHLPRSQSQPGYSERWPPHSHQHTEFDFGVSRPMDRRPATSASTYNSGPYNGRTPMDRPPETRPPHGSRQKPRNGLGPGPGPENRQLNVLEPRRFGQGVVQLDKHRSPQIYSRSLPSKHTQPPFSKPSSQSLGGPTPPPQKPPPNPDALPHHPAPVRPGHGGGIPSNQSVRPAPLRQYNNAPQDLVQQSASSRSTGGRGILGLVTLQDLEGLRQKTHRHPNDSAVQFQLAKRLIEAADVLVDERADPGTKKRNRENYYSDALKIIKKLSAISYTEADFYYADCYSRGALGLQSDIKEAFLLYQKAAKANHAQAAYRVAVCCELGQEEGGGTKRDAVKAMQWYRRAATLGDVAAMYKMGVVQLKGLLGQPKDPKDAVNWLKRAAERADKENPHALHELALLHEKPINVDGIRQDEAYSRTLFTQAASLGYKFSQFRLGCAYEYGLLGCHVDPRQSIAWYSKAAVQDEHQSELALSGWYLTGSEGVLQQSDTEAYLWARKAAQAGLAKAEYAMGYFTEVGIGAPANLEDAKRWYWKSASQNFPKARDRLEDLRKGGGPKQKARVSRSQMKKQSDGECIVM